MYFQVRAHGLALLPEQEKGLVGSSRKRGSAQGLLLREVWQCQGTALLVPSWCHLSPSWSPLSPPGAI